MYLFIHTSEAIRCESTREERAELSFLAIKMKAGSSLPLGKEKEREKCEDRWDEGKKKMQVPQGTYYWYNNSILV